MRSPVIPPEWQGGVTECRLVEVQVRRNPRPSGHVNAHAKEGYDNQENFAQNEFFLGSRRGGLRLVLPSLFSLPIQSLPEGPLFLLAMPAGADTLGAVSVSIGYPCFPLGCMYEEPAPTARKPTGHPLN